jgi:hypothetical protein
MVRFIDKDFRSTERTRSSGRLVPCPCSLRLAIRRLRPVRRTVAPPSRRLSVGRPARRYGLSISRRRCWCMRRGRGRPRDSRQDAGATLTRRP